MAKSSFQVATFSAVDKAPFGAVHSVGRDLSGVPIISWDFVISEKVKLPRYSGCQ